MSYQVCSKQVKGIYEVASSSAQKKYRVDFNNCPPTCTCVAYAIARNRAGGKNHGGAAICKHINSIYDSTCDFDSRKHGESMLPICPHCGAKLTIVETDTAPKNVPLSTQSGLADQLNRSTGKVTPVASNASNNLQVAPRPQRTAHRVSQPTDPLLDILDKRIVRFTGVVKKVDKSTRSITIEITDGNLPDVGCNIRGVGSTE